MPVLRIRNPVARAPILRKGGVHVKSKSSQRAQARKELQSAVVRWEKKQGR